MWWRGDGGMSIKLMAAIFESTTLGPTERLVLLALADHADDDGRCYPSIQRLCQRTGLGERAMQGNIQKLRASGHITIIPGGGRSRPNTYIVCANPAEETVFLTQNPAPETPFPAQNPAYCALNPAFGALNPAADAPEPSRTIIEPSEEKIDARGAIIAAVGLIDPDFDAAVVSFCAYRRKSKAKALTLTAAKRLGESLRAIMDGGGSPADALGMAEERGWQTIKPDWYFREAGHGDGTHGGTANATGGAPRGPAPGGGGSRASIASVAARMRAQG